MQRNFKLFYIESALSFATFTLMNGIFLIGIALLFGANTFQIGLLAAIPLFSNVFQVISSYLIERTGNRKSIAMYSLFGARLVWIVVVMIAIGVLKTENKIGWLILIVLISSILTSIGNLSLISWMSKLVPENVLARFFSKRNIYSAIAGIAAYFFGALLIQAYHSQTMFALIFLLAMIIGLSSVPILRQIDFVRTEKTRKGFLKYLKEIRVPFKDENFRPFLRFIGFWSFSINFASPFFIVYMLDDLKLGFLMVAIFIIIDSLARIYGMRIWGGIGDKLGAKGILIFSATISSTIPLWFIFINKSNYLFIPLIFVISAFSYAAVDISLAQLLFKLCPRKNDSIYLTSFYGLIGICSALGPIVGGALAIIISNYIPLFGFPALAFIFGLSFLLRVSALPWIRHIKERDARDIHDVIENVKKLRFVSFVANFYSFADLISKFVLVPQEELRILQKKAYIHLKSNIVNSVKLSKNALKAIGRKKNFELIDKLAKDIHYIFLHLELPTKYSEYKAIKELDNELRGVTNLLSKGPIGEKKITEMKSMIRKNKNILDKFLNKVIFLRKE